MADVASNVVGNIIAAVLLALLGGLLSVGLRLPFVYRDRRKLFGFLGVCKEQPDFVVYLSTVFVVSGGSVDFKGAPRSFHGPAIPAAELSVVQPISQLFASPLLDSLPASVRSWLGQCAGWYFRDIAPIFCPSPLSRTQVAPTNMIAVGSQYYNTAGDLYAQTGDPFLRMVEPSPGRMVISVAKGPRSGDEFEQRAGADDDLAIVERVFDPVCKTSIFVTAGIGIVGTLGAVNFLVDNWRKLQNDFGHDPFALCLRFCDVSGDPSAYKKPIEIAK